MVTGDQIMFALGFFFFFLIDDHHSYLSVSLRTFILTQKNCNWLIYEILYDYRTPSVPSVFSEIFKTDKNLRSKRARVYVKSYETNIISKCLGSELT